MKLDPTIVVGILTLLGTILTVWAGFSQTRNKIMFELDKHNAVQDERIKALTQEVKKHNEFAERIPNLEAKYETLEKRVDKLESK